MLRVGRLSLGRLDLLGPTRTYLELLGPTRTYSNPVKWLAEMATEVFYLRFYQITAQDGPIIALTYSELLGLTLTRSAPQARESRQACGAVLSVLTGAGEGVVLGRVLGAGAVP